MPLKGTIRRDDNKEFVLDQFLGSGLLGVVYRGVELRASGEQVAVKEPAPNLTLDQRERFGEEYDVLTRLAGKLHDPLPVPRVWRGENLETGRKVLVLEYAPPELSRQLAALDGLEREKTALATAAQYARLLQALHTVERSDGEVGFTCADRKSGDLRWNAELGRLMVLDWNVVRPRSESGVRDDIHLFGSLWYQLLTDRYARDDPPLLDDRLWDNGGISIGVRYLLARALAANPRRRYANAGELAKDVQKWKLAFSQTGEELYRIGHEELEKASQANRSAKRYLGWDSQRLATSLENVPHLDLDAERAALAYLDLAVRKGEERAEGDRDQARNMVGRQGDRLVQGAALAFEVTQYESGNRFLEWAEAALRDAEELTAYDPGLKLRVRRWQLLLRAGRLTIEHGLELRPSRHDLAGAVRGLEEATANRHKGGQLESDWNSPAERIITVVQRLRIQQSDHPVAPVLEYLGKEAQAQALFTRSQYERGLGRYYQAAELLQKADELLSFDDGLDQAACDYLRALRENLPDLEAERRGLLLRGRVAEIVSKLKDEASLGQKTGDLLASWYALWRIEDVRRTFTEGDEQLAELENIVKPEEKLLEVGNLQAAGNWSESITRLHDLLILFPSYDPIRDRVERYLKAAAEQARELASSGRPKSDQDALSLVRQIRAAGSLLAKQSDMRRRSV